MTLWPAKKLDRRGGFTPLQPGHSTILGKGEEKIKRARWNPRSLGRVVTGFTLIEVIVVMGIIAIMASVILVSVTRIRARARDVRRRVELNQVGQFLSASCFLPDAGGGDYDLQPLMVEVKAKFPQYANRFPRVPRDPRIGTDIEAYYRYIVSADGKKCAVYANLENEAEPVTLSGISVPTPGGGTGVFQAAGGGWNGSTKYLEVSN